MSDNRLSYEELQERLARAEAALDSLRRGEVDLMIGTKEPLVMRFRSLVEENERLSREWQQTFDSLKDAVWVLDAEQRVLRANQAEEELFNRPVKEMVGRHCWEIVHGTPEPIPDCPIPRMRRSLKRERMELQIGDRWFEVTVDPIVDGDNRLSGAVHIVSDITERREMEEALRQSETRNRIIADLISDYAYIFRVTEEGRLQGEWVTESFTKVFGLTLAEIDARGGWQSLVHPGDLSLALQHASKVARGQTDICEMRWVTSNGEVRWLCDYAKPVFNASGKRVVRIFGASQDITDRKRAEAELGRLTMAIEQTGDAILVTDTEGSIQYVNPAFETVTGYTRLEAIGQNPRLLKSGKQDRAFYQELWSTITQGRIWKGRMVNKRKDGELYTEETTISPVKDGSGRIVSFVAVKRDITEHLLITQEQARLQEQLQQAQKMESIGRLAGGVAHDFNNMLSVILGFGEIIQEKLLPGDPLKEDVEEILKAGRRSAELTRQLLAFSRKQTLQPEVLDLNDVVRNIEKMLRRLIGEDIELELSLSKDLDPVKVDPGQIEQVIMNLAVNARDTMPSGGRLLVETQQVELDATYARHHQGVSPGKYILLAISDTGCGMDKEVLAQIFDPFFTTKEKGKGTGLGLATVYGIVKQSGGNIWAYSEPGKGSTFKIYLPVTGDQPMASAREAAREELSGGGERILVVEDEAAVRGLMKEMLSKSGYEVTLAANGGEALLLVEEKGLRPDLIITDVVMPGMSGAVLVERLRRSRPDLKVLFMSGYTDNAIVHHGVLDPGTLFIQKPFSFQGIAEKIREVLKKG